MGLGFNTSFRVDFGVVNIPWVTKWGLKYVYGAESIRDGLWGCE